MADPVRIVGGNFDDKKNEGIQAQVSSWGSLHVVNDGYILSDEDERDENYYYYGFVNRDGGWKIMRKTNDNPSAFRFAFGESGYSLAWTNKNSLNYKLYSVVS